MSRARDIASPNIIAFEYSPRTFGADRTGAVDSTAAFLSALAAGNVKGHPGDKYLIGNITVPGGRTVIGNGAQIRPVAGSSHVFRLSGYRPRLEGLNLDGYTENHVAKSVTTGSQGNGATVIGVANASRFAARMPIIVIQNGRTPHFTLISSVNVGAGTITLRDGIPQGTFTGAEVAASFGLIHVQDSTWAEIYDTTVVNGAFSLMMVPSAGPAVTAKARIANFDTDGEHYCGFAKFENTGDIAVSGMRLRGGLTQERGFAGSGFSGPFPLQRPLYLYRDLTVTVNGVARTYGTHYTVDANGIDIYFQPGFYPAPGAAIQTWHFVDGYVGFTDDQRCPSGIILPSGNEYTDVQVLDFDFGIRCSGAFLTDFSNVISDTCSRASMVIDNASGVDQSLNFEDTFIGFSPDAVQCYDATAKFTGKFETNLVPANQWLGNTLGKTIRTSGTAIVSVQADHVVANSNDFSWAGAGELDLNGGHVITLKTGVMTAGGNDQVGMNGLEIGAGGEAIPLSSRGKALRLIALPANAPGVGESFFYELFLNGVATGLAGTVTGAGLTLDVVGSIPLFGLSGLTVQVVRSAGAAACTHRIMVVTTG